MNNNQGFTLVELLAVIVILASISLIAVGGISASLEKRDEKECKEQIELAISAAKIYFSLNGGTTVSVETLSGKYFSANSKYDRLKKADTITINGNQYVYSNPTCS